MIPAFRLDLRRSRSLILWVGLVAVLYAGVMVAFYPSVLANAEEFDRMVEIYPKELLAAFGITDGGISDPGTYVNSYIFQFLWPVVASIAAIALATRPAADATSGFLDLPLSSRLPRLDYLAVTIGVQVVSLAILSALTVGAIVAVDLLIEPDFDAGRIALAGLHLFAMAIAIAGATTALAVALLDRGRAAGLMAGILMTMYLLNVVAGLAPEVRDLGRLSVFYYFDLQPVIDDGVFPAGESLLYLVVAVTGWVSAAAIFRRRDLAA